MGVFKTSNQTINQEGHISQNQEPEPGTLFLVGSWFLLVSFGFGLPLLCTYSILSAFALLARVNGEVLIANAKADIGENS